MVVGRPGDMPWFNGHHGLSLCLYRSPTKGSRGENQKRQTVWLLNPGCLMGIFIMVYGRIPTELGSRIPLFCPTNRFFLITADVLIIRNQMMFKFCWNLRHVHTPRNLAKGRKMVKQNQENVPHYVPRETSTRITHGKTTKTTLQLSWKKTKQPTPKPKQQQKQLVLLWPWFFLGGTRLTVNVAADPLGFLSCFDALSNGSHQSCLQLLSLLVEGSWWKKLVWYVWYCWWQPEIRHKLTSWGNGSLSTVIYRVAPMEVLGKTPFHHLLTFDEPGFCRVSKLTRIHWVIF